MQRNFALKEQAAGLKFSSESAKRAFMADLEAQKLPIQDGKVLGFDDFAKSYRERDPGALPARRKAAALFRIGHRPRRRWHKEGPGKRGHPRGVRPRTNNMIF